MRPTVTFLLVMSLLAPLAISARGEDAAAPAPAFAPAVDFGTDIMALLSRLGCN